MPTAAQLRRWRLRQTNGWSIRRIAAAETKPKVSHMAVHRALATPTVVDSRRKPRVDIGTLARCNRIAANIHAFHPEGYRRLRNLHADMLATDVTRVLKEVQRDVLKALGFPIG